MKFSETTVMGAFVIEVEQIGDDRGHFGRLWCEREFSERGLTAKIAQSNIGVNPRAGTQRGLHYQKSPHLEAKIVRCSRGAMFDVVVDVRPDSPTHLEWFGIELTADSATMLYVPEGCATGYITLVDDTEMYYHATAPYEPSSATGVRYDDPAFGIEWPREPSIISEGDRSWPDYSNFAASESATTSAAGAVTSRASAA